MDAETITAIAGLVAAFGTIIVGCLTAIVILKTSHIVKPTNSSFSTMQATLNDSLKAQQIQTEQAQKLTGQVVEAAIGKAVRENGPDTPAGTPTLAVVDSIATESVTADQLNVTDPQAEGIAEAVVEAVDKKANPE